MIESLFNQLLSHTQDPRVSNQLSETPARSAKAFTNLLAGYHTNPYQLLVKARQPANFEYTGSIEIPEIAFVSFCEHTFLPFMGTVSLNYQPGQYWIDAMTLESVIHAHARRLTLQEALTAQIWNTCFTALEPKSLKIKMEARHACMNGKLMRTEIGT